MKICYMSDLHTESYEGKSIKSLPKLKGDVLIIAGDFGYCQNNNYNPAAKDYLTELKKNFDVIYLIPGNHEYYTGEYFDLPIGVNELKDNPGCYTVKDSVVYYKNLKILGTTLFPIISDELRLSPGSRLNDFNHIHYNPDGTPIHRCIHFDKSSDLMQSFLDYISGTDLPKNITPSDMDTLHNNSIKLLKDFTHDDNMVNIVVTHFPPIDDVRKASGRDFSDLLSSYFYNEVRKDGIDLSKFDYWIYGHNHYNPVSDIEVDGCKIICNQMGYKGELNTFKKRFIEV